MSGISGSDFQSAELKIEWAKQHIHNLQVNLEGFHRNGNHRFFLEENPKSGRTDLILHTDPLPAFVLLLIGDAVHNLSSALDHAWNVLARSCQESRAKLTFPTNESWENLKLSVGNSPIKAAFPEIENIIFEEIAPAKDRKGHNLWAIRKLDNLDKHNLIIPATQVSGVKDFIARDDRGATFMGGSITVHGTGAHTTITSFEGKAELHGNPIPSIDVRFSSDQFMPDQPVLSALRRTTQVVSETVHLIKDRFSSNA